MSRKSIFGSDKKVDDGLKIKLRHRGPAGSQHDAAVRGFLGENGPDDDDNTYVKQYRPDGARGSKSRLCAGTCLLLLIFTTVSAVFYCVMWYVSKNVAARYVDVSGIHMLHAYLKRLPTTLPLHCHGRANTDASGVLVGTRNGPAYIQPDAAACCDNCKKTAECTVFVYNEKNKECWLKNQPDNNFPERPLVYTNENLEFTAGAMFYEPYEKNVAVSNSTCVDLIVSSNGGAEHNYVNWQTKILYSNIKQVVIPLSTQPSYVPVNFFRLLHRTKDDGLSDKVPTVRVEPRRASCDAGCDFPVGDRADAFLKLVNSNKLKCDYTFLVETDYVFVDWIKLDELPAENVFMGFHYGYIVPEHESVKELSHRFAPRVDARAIPGTGPAPGIMRRETFEKVVKTWSILQQRIDDDAEAVQKFGWVRDMYSFSYALALAKIKSHIPLVPYNTLMIQIPADNTVGNAKLLHWTWGPVINVNGSVVWQFDKRKIDGSKLKPVEDLPPWNSLMRLQANETVTHGVYDVLRLFVKIFNRALLEEKETTHDATAQV